MVTTCEGLDKLRGHFRSLLPHPWSRIGTPCFIVLVLDDRSSCGAGTWRPPFIARPVSLHPSILGESSTQQLWSYYFALGTMPAAGATKTNCVLRSQELTAASRPSLLLYFLSAAVALFSCVPQGHDLLLPLRKAEPLPYGKAQAYLPGSPCHLLPSLCLRIFTCHLFFQLRVRIPSTWLKQRGFYMSL